MSRRAWTLSLSKWVLLGAGLVFSVGPFVWLFVGSLIPEHTDRGLGVAGVRRAGLENYRLVFEGNSMAGCWRATLNSVMVGVGAGSGVAAITLLASVALRKGRAYAGSALEFLTTMGYALPPVVLVVPYCLMLRGHEYRGLPALAVAHAAFCLPFAFWLMVKYVDAVPLELDMAVACDGGGLLCGIRHLYLRHAAPGIGAIVSLCLILAWNDCLLAPILTRNSTEWTIAVYAKEKILDNADHAVYGVFSALSVMMSLGAIVAFGLVHIWSMSALGDAGNRGGHDV